MAFYRRRFLLSKQVASASGRSEQFTRLKEAAGQYLLWLTKQKLEVFIFQLPQRQQAANGGRFQFPIV